jgi:signal transduction histidine kinase
MKFNTDYYFRRRVIIIITGVLFFASPLAAAAESATPKNVLILLSVEYGLPAYDLILNEIQMKLRQGVPGPINMYAEYIDSARFPDERYQQKLFSFYNEKYAQLNVDLIIAIGPNLLQILNRHSTSRFAGLPTVVIDLLQLNTEIPSALRKPNMTGVFFNIDLQKNFELALSLHPDTKRVYIVVGASKMDAYFERLARTAARKYENALTVEYLKGLPMEDTLQKVQKLPADSVVLMMTTQTDALEVPYYTREATRLIAARSIAPVYVLLDSNMDVGGVGGYVVRFKRGGIVAGKMALRILGGEPPGAIAPVREGLSQYMFDWRQLKRWGIPEHRLPQGSIVTHRQESFFEKYKWLVIGGIVFVAVQSCLVGFLIVLNRKQRKLSANLVAAEERYRRLLRVERASRLGELLASLAHEINQPLSASLSSTQAALRFLRANPINIERLREILQNVVQDNKRAAGVIRSIRAMLKRRQIEMVPILIDDILNDVFTVFRGEAIARGIYIEKRFESSLPPVMANKSQLQQVVLNLIMNAADAVAENKTENRKILLKSSENDGKVQVAVRDTGAGIDPATIEKVFEPFFTTKIEGMGMGLALCRSIIEEHGGRIRVEKNATAGVTVTFELPAIKNE